MFLSQKSGCIVIDNTSYFRQNDDVPLIAYGVNDEEVKNHKGIIARSKLFNDSNGCSIKTDS